jgi:hypothetical protein
LTKPNFSVADATVLPELRSPALVISQWEPFDRRTRPLPARWPRFSEAPDFLCIADDQRSLFDVGRIVLAGPYPKASAAMCKDFHQVSELTKLLRPSLLILLNQNLLLADQGRELRLLLRAMPALSVSVRSGWVGVTDFFANDTEATRIDFASGVPEPREFHRDIARRYEFSFDSIAGRMP